MAAQWTFKPGRWNFVGRDTPVGIGPSIDGRECYAWVRLDNTGVPREHYIHPVKHILGYT